MAPMVVEANTFPDHKVMVAVVFAAVAVAMAEGFNYCWKESSGEENQRSDRIGTGHKRFVNSAKHSGGRALLLQRRYVSDNTHVNG